MLYTTLIIEMTKEAEARGLRFSMDSADTNDSNDGRDGKVEMAED